MTPGDVVDERFVVTVRAAEGGMGTVYRARDRQNGRDVALKVLIELTADNAARFEREGNVLAQIAHPNIVGYVGHGRMSDGRLWLAMDWINGETLAQRLARGPLDVAQTVTLGIQIARALGEAHRHGLVHRDIKPSNLLLVGDVVKIVDFGIVQAAARPGNTRTGTVIGTPGYMAPEQARGGYAVDARADVFSLGCVLFECLTGKPAFTGEHLLAILAKIILEDAPRVSELRPEVPSGLTDLIARMLAKDPEPRPLDGDAVAHALATFPQGQRYSRPRTPALTEGEQRIVSVVLAGTPREAVVHDQTATVVEEARLDELRSTTLPADAQLERLADGTLLVAIWGRSNARDQAAQAVHAAMVLEQLTTDVVVVATGRGVIAGKWPVGDVIDRAAHMVRSGARANGIQLDELTAGLLDSRHAVRVEARGFFLEKAHHRDDSARRLCGVQTTCVGRDRELRLLQDLYTEVREEQAARAVLVVGPGGGGKSRLRQELLARIGVDHELLIGRGDPMRAGSPFSLVSHGLRWMIGIVEGEPVAVQRRRIAAHLARFFDGEDLRRVAMFLGELIGVPADGEDPALLAARRDPVLMADRRREAWLDWLRATTRDERPIVIVLEDLHYGDAGTIELVDAALRELADRPLYVLALARPEVREQFPRLWAGRQLTELALPELSRRAAEKLVREVLGEPAPELVSRIVDRAAGNAFYLEELIRAVAGGQLALPETVLATVQVRLEALAPDLRRLLRAASVFGEVVRAEGLAALTGPTDGLAELVRLELLQRRATSRGDSEYVFRHALVREAAYAMLTDADRTLGHQLAGDYLDAAGETDALVLAEHFERGGVRDRAITAYARAAEQALAGNIFGAAIARAERGIELGATGATRARLRLAQADAHRWRGELPDSGARAAEAARDLPVGSAAWFRALELSVVASVRRADYTEAMDRVRAAAVVPEPELDNEARSARIVALCEAGRALLQMGRYDLGDELVDRVDAAALDLTGLEPTAIVQIHRLRAARARHAGDLMGDLRGYQAVLAAFESCGDARSACNARVSVGFAYLELGAYADGETELRRALAEAERSRLDTVATRARQNLALVLSHAGDHTGARTLIEHVIAESIAHGNHRFAAWSRIYLARIALAGDDAHTAEAEALAAADAFAETPPALAGALAYLALARCALGRADEATARRAMMLLEQLAGIEEFELAVWLALVETLAALGTHDAGEVAHHARTRVAALAERITDRDLRRAFLDNVPESSALLSRATMRGV